MDISNTRTNNFQFTIENAPLMSKKVVSTTLPNLSLGEITLPTRTVDYTMAGSKITFGKVLLDFILDEDFGNYMEIYDWMNYLRNPKNYPKFNEKYSDGTLIILNNTKNPIRQFKFIDMFPIELADVQFATSNNDDTTVSATFSFSYFETEAIN